MRTGPSTRAALGAIVLALLCGRAAAQGITDHLQCYKVSNATLQRLRAVVDLDAPSVDLAPGCKLGPVRLHCVPARRTVRPGTAFDGSAPVALLPYQGPPAETERLCYRVTCPKGVGTAPDSTVTDAFGTHRLARASTNLVCAPANNGATPSPATGFTITSPEVAIDPGQNITYCYYFRTPNAAPLAIRRFTSSMRGVNRRVVLFTTTNSQGQAMDRLPPGTISTIDCSGLPTGQVVPHWVYESDAPSGELTMPDDDGAGRPVAFELPPLSSGFLLMHHRNDTDQVLKGQVTVTAEALDSAVYTRTDTFTGMTADLVVPPLSTGVVVQDACTLPAGARFWALSTFTHQHAVRTDIRDGQDAVFEATDWAHPGVRTWPSPPFFTFASNTLAYACTYDNPFTFPLRAGTSVQTEEQCMAVGWVVPATGPRWCLNGYGPYPF
jgi:hypothetical protein